MTAPRTIVLGGGILGAATAAALASSGAHTTLLTAGRLADGASGRTLSWLNSFGRIPPDYHRLRRAGLDRYRALHTREQSLRGPITFGGNLTWRTDLDSLTAAYEHMVAAGYPAQWLMPDQVAAQVPGVAAANVPETGAVFTPEEGWVEIAPLVHHLAAQVERAGGTVRTGVGPATVSVAGSRATGVVLADGSRLDADVVVLATGAAVPAALAELGAPVPDATSIALLVRTGPTGNPLRAVLNTPKVSMRPTPDGGLVMDSATTNAAARQRPDGCFEAPPDAVVQLLRDASSVLSGQPALEVVDVGIGAKPIPGDELPVVGQIAGLDGGYVAFTHSGATLGLVLGDLLAAEITTGVRDELLAPFGMDRFRAR